MLVTLDIFKGKDLFIFVQDLSAQDIGETLEDVLDTIGKNKKKLLVEKEELDDLKEEMQDYKEVT